MSREAMDRICNRPKNPPEKIDEKAIAETGGSLFDLPDDLMNPQFSLANVLDKHNEQKEVQDIIHELEKEKI